MKGRGFAFLRKSRSVELCNYYNGACDEAFAGICGIIGLWICGFLLLWEFERIVRWACGFIGM